MTGQDAQSYRSNWTSYDQDSFKPPTPQLSVPHQDAASLHTSVEPPFMPKQTRPLPFHLPDTLNMTSTDAQLEERRRAAIREKEREAAAKERNKQLLAKRREEQLRLRQQIEEEAKGREQSVREAEEERLAKIEAARLAKLKAKEDEERLREEERRRLAAVELRREKALQALESQTLRAAEHQKMQREAILQKRQHAERVKEETQRLYQQRLAEEQQRKADLVAAMNRYREDKMASLEARKQSALLNKQEEELSQMVQVQATLSRLTARMHDIQVRREETRHKLLEARHLVEILLIDENDLTLAHDEVEADLIKLKAHEEALARLVSTRYEHDEYETAVLTIQRYFRGARDRVLCAELRAVKTDRELEKAAQDIQKVFRGKRQRDKDRERIEREKREMQQATIKVQSLFRGRKDRKLGQEKRMERELRLLRERMATRLQAWWRGIQAKEMMGLLKEMESLNLIKVKSQQRGAAGGLKPGSAKGGFRGKRAGSGGSRGGFGASERLSEVGQKGRKADAVSPIRRGEGGHNRTGAGSRVGSTDGRMSAAPSVSGKGGGESSRSGIAGGDQGALQALKLEAEAKLLADARSVGGAGDMDWVTREQLRAEQRKLRMEMNMAEAKRSEMGRIYLNPSGRPPNKASRGGPREKRMFVPLAATQRAANVMAPLVDEFQLPPSQQQQHMHVLPSQGVIEGTVISQDYEPLYSAQDPQQQRQTKRPPAPPGVSAPNHAVARGGPLAGGFPELNREQASNYTPRTSSPPEKS